MKNLQRNKTQKKIKHKTYTKKDRTKNKNNIKIRKHIGGVNANIVFACTTLSKESTLSMNFDLIIGTIAKYIHYDIPKNAYFLMKNKIHPDSDFLLQRLTHNNYNVDIKDGLVKDIDVSAFLMSCQPNSIDAIVFAQCNDFISSFCSDSFSGFAGKKTLDHKVHAYEELFDIIKVSLYQLYDTLKMDGYILNCYYDHDSTTQSIKSLHDIDDNLSFGTTSYILLHKVVCEIFNNLFEKTETGVYKKKPLKQDFEELCNSIFGRNAADFFSIITEYSKPIDERVQELLESFAPSLLLPSMLSQLPLVIKNIKKGIK